MSFSRFGRGWILKIVKSTKSTAMKFSVQMEGFAQISTQYEFCSQNELLSIEHIRFLTLKLELEFDWLQNSLF